MKKSQAGVLLKGGIGNQLFQIAAALYLNQESRIDLYRDFTLPRKSQGIPDSTFFSLPLNFNDVSISSTLIDRKLLSLSLRKALAMPRGRRSRMSKFLVGAAVDFYFSLRFKRIVKVISGDGVGYSPLSLKPGYNLLNGYFQSYLYSKDSFVRNRMRSIEIRSKSAKLLELIGKAKEDNPIFIHLRLGDYRKEKSIGILPPDYYKKALTHLTSKDVSRKIWIFSDEPASVNSFIDAPSPYEMVIVDDQGLNPAEVLELMRYGSAYIIANSTFSWWGAFLAYNDDCIRIMPTPWFQGAPSPEGIRPKEWIEIEYLE
jgi:hypothetical protein